jgi:hypothetical protein
MTQHLVEKLLSKYDIRRMDGTTFEVLEEFTKDISQIIADTERTTRERIAKVLLDDENRVVQAVGRALTPPPQKTEMMSRIAEDWHKQAETLVDKK